MSCKLEIPLSLSPEMAVEKARSAVQNMNGSFTGDHRSGTFELNVFGNLVKGEYVIDDHILRLEVTDKPFFVPCSSIESFLRKQFT